MKQYKIKVNNEAEAVEAQDLFEKLGYKKEVFVISDFPKCVVTDHWHINGEDWWYSCGAGYPRENVLHEELSLEELRTLATPRSISNDTVNHPNHYASSAIECIDAMEAMLTHEQFIGYLRGNIFKYQWRYEKKNGIEDLKKSQWYLGRLMEKLSEK